MKEPRVYTAYHFYFSLLLEYLLKNYGYDVEPLVKVGKLPLEVDIIVIKDRDKLRTKDFVQLDFLFQRLSDYNLIEFKGPTDTLTWQDYLHLEAVSYLYRIKIDHREKNDVRLFTIASTIPEDFSEFLSSNGVRPEKISAGLYSLIGSSAYRHYLLALNEMDPDTRNELLLFFSSKYHDRMSEIISDEENKITLYLIQELFQKERRKMKFKIKDEDLVVRDLREVVRRIPIEWRLEGITPKDRLKGLSPEERLHGLKPEDLKRLKQLLDKLNLS